MNYDFIVVGGGLAGLAIAHRLSSESGKVLLVEGQESPLGSLRQVETPHGVLSNGLNLLPASEAAGEALDFLRSLLEIPLSTENSTLALTTYESGSFRPFVGFGDNQPKFIDQITPFLQESYLRTSPTAPEWAALLAQNPRFTLQMRSLGTRLEVMDGRVSSLMLNAQKKVTADQYIFAGPLTALPGLLAQEHWPSKALTRFGKLKFWTRIGLDLVHNREGGEDYDDQALYVLDGTTADDLGPCLGRFYGINERQAVSQWMSLLDDSEAEDSEVLAQAFKKMKRQIKRAFPELSASVQFERLVVFPGAFLSPVNGSFLPELENLRFANGQLSALPGPLGALDQADKALKDLGFLPKPLAPMTL